YGVLVPLAESINDSEEKKILTHFGITEGTAYSSFAEIAKLSPAAVTKADTAVAPPIAPPPVRADGEFRVVFFYKVGCKECEHTRDLLQDLAASYPKMILQERDISEPLATQQHEVLSTRFQ